MTCPGCGAETIGGRRFCTACGTALPAACPACGSSSPAEAKFCADCGAPIGAGERAGPVRSEHAAAASGPAAALTTAERRPLSVMFCDLIGSTALSSRLDAEDLREVIRSYQACVAATIRATGAVVSTPIMLMWAAEAYTMLGRPDKGLACLAEAAQIIETTEERCHEAELHRLRGDFLHADGDLSASELSYHQSLEVARSQSAKLLELRASTRLARLWRDQGKRAEARDLLGPIYNWFTEGFDAPDLKDAKALLDELVLAAAAHQPVTG